MKSILTVWWDNMAAGALTLDEHGDMGFTYAPEWLGDETRPPLSISLPKRKEPFARRQCRPFFAGLLPEEKVREAVARNLGISKGNDFALLEALGGDIAGALSLWPAGHRPPQYNGKTATEALSDAELLRVLEELPKRPLLAGIDGLRLSLAGAQDKLPVVLVDGKVALPVPGQPTTHILKPPIPDHPATTENEAFVMRLAAGIELDVASVEPRKTGPRKYLLITRYDRLRGEDGLVRRLHQEDFCQALGIMPENKYAADRHGPTFKAIFALLRAAATRPAVEALKLLDAAIFNIVVGNADAHGKNFSLLHGSDATVLAPLYDLMCTTAYPQVSAKSAMKIGDASTLDQLTPRNWERFAEGAGLAAGFVKRRVKALCEAIDSQVNAASQTIAGEGFDAQELARFAAIVRERADIVGASV